MRSEISALGVHSKINSFVVKNKFGLKKIFIALFLVALLSSCGAKTEEVKTKNDTQKVEVTDTSIDSDKDTQKIDENIMSDNNQIVYEGEENNEAEKERGKQLKELIVLEEKLQKDGKKLWEIRNQANAYNFYNLDCKKEFQTEEKIRECQELALKEIRFGCADLFGKDAMGKIDLDKLINKEKFSFSDEKELNELKKSCKEKRIQEEEQQKEMLKMEEKRENLEKQINDTAKNFKLSDCKKYFSGKSLEEQKREIRNNKDIPDDFKSDMIDSLEKNYIDPVKQCKIGFAINHRNTCDILSGDLKEECIQIKSDIKAFERMQDNHRKYGNFNVLNELMNNKFEKQGLGAPVGPMGMGGFNDGMGPMGMGDFVR